ncbi:MAG: lauroyl acyltransferase [Paracoccaceae bacterium]
MRKKSKLRYYVEALPIWLLPKLLRPLPFRMRVRIGAWLLAGVLRLVPSLRKRITNNLDHVFPEMPKAEKKRLLRKITRNIGLGFFELIYNTEYQKRRHEMRLTGDIAPIEAAHAAGRPVLLVSAHFGQFEAARAMIGPRTKPLAGLYHPAHNPVFERIYTPAITSAGQMFPTTPRGMAALSRHLKDGGFVALLLDQYADDGVPMPFVGRMAKTGLSMTRLALKHDALIVPLICVRGEDGVTIEVQIAPPLERSDAKTMTRALNDFMSAEILKRPEQWYWLHRRWKNVESAQTEDA